jgi:hypothetical protein
MAEKSSLGTAKTWFILEKYVERKLAKLKCLPLLTVLPLNYFMAYLNIHLYIATIDLVEPIIFD